MNPLVRYVNVDSWTDTKWDWYEDWSSISCDGEYQIGRFIELKIFFLQYQLIISLIGHSESDHLTTKENKWAPSGEFVSSSITSWQILTAHAQPFRGARDLAFCLKGPLDSLPVWASSGGSGETARMHRLAWTFAARISDKYQIRLTRSKSQWVVW